MNSQINSYALYDRALLWLSIGLIIIGFVMVMSTSMTIGAHLLNDPLYFAKRNAFYVSFALILPVLTLRISMRVWERYSSMMLIMTMVMLLTVLLFGNSVNGASRWIVCGSIRIQPAELSKPALLFYLSSYLSRKLEEVRNNFWGFCKPIVIVMLLAILLSAQPDLGTIVILFVITLSMLFLAGAKLWQFFPTVSLSAFLAMFLVITKPYQVRRLTSFWNPWSDPFGAGYQLTQSLMAFGRGSIMGQGLGNSIQKLEYLPEAHTDFIVSILAEELGYFGVLLLLLMTFAISFRAMSIGRNALENNQHFSGFLSCSIGIWFAFQTLINVGATTGILPTKGLTFPLISYGGSSLLIMSTAIMVLLRADFETRLAKVQAFTNKVQ